MAASKKKANNVFTPSGVGSFLKTKRVEAGVTQSKAAKALGYSSPQYISNFERGLCEPSVHTALKLTKVYGINKNELYKVMLQSFENNLKTAFKQAA